MFLGHWPCFFFFFLFFFCFDTGEGFVWIFPLLTDSINKRLVGWCRIVRMVGGGRWEVEVEYMGVPHHSYVCVYPMNDPFVFELGFVSYETTIKIMDGGVCACCGRWIFERRPMVVVLSGGKW